MGCTLRKDYTVNNGGLERDLVFRRHERGETGETVRGECVSGRIESEMR